MAKKGKRSARRWSRRKHPLGADRKWKVLSLLMMVTLSAMMLWWWSRRDIGSVGDNDSRQRLHEVSIFFSNSQRDPDGVDCSLVFPVRRQVFGSAVARGALEALLKGPTAKESEEGFYSSINANVRIRSLSVSNRLASVDFDATFDRNVAGACRVEAIRAQVTRTLLQFETVDSVEVTVEGQESSALQP